MKFSFQKSVKYYKGGEKSFFFVQFQMCQRQGLNFFTPLTLHKPEIPFFKVQICIERFHQFYVDIFQFCYLSFN
jgi:hypothetical protein